MSVIVWIHEDCIRRDNPAWRRYPAAPAIWIWDVEELRVSPVTLKRIVFQYECLLDIPVAIRRGTTASALLEFAAEHSADRMVTVKSPNPRVSKVCEALSARIAVELVEPDAFVDFHGRLDLKRFSRYWKRVGEIALEG